MCEFEIKNDETGTKILDACFNCIWGTKSSIAKIKCSKKFAKVLQKDEGWMCHSYISKNARQKIKYVIKWE